MPNKISKYKFASKHFRIVIALLVIAISTLSLYTLGLLNTQSVQKSIKLATSQQAENITELYFTDYQSIIKNAETNKLYTISFSTVNHESKQMNYPYNIILVSNNVATKTENGTFKLNDSETKEIRFDVTFPKADTDYQLVIQLPTVNQEINVRIST